MTNELPPHTLRLLSAKSLAVDDIFHTYLLRRFPASMVVMGDLHPALLHHAARAAVAIGPDGPEGAAVRFEAFASPVIAAVAESPALIRELAGSLADGITGPLLVIAANELGLIELFGATEVDDDLWMTCDLHEANADLGTPEAPDFEEAASFYRTCGMDFFHPDLLRLGHWMSLRAEGILISGAGLGFIVPVTSYAHIANVSTLPALRGRGYARHLIGQLCLHLAAAGFRRCGLFCDRTDDRLVQFYHRLGFRASGRFLTITTHGLKSL